MQNYLQPNKILVGLCTLVVLGFSLFSCEYENENELFPPKQLGGPGCDTVDISYSLVIQPIFNASCATSGCHDDQGAQFSFGINLSNYDEVNDLNSARLLRAIKHKGIYPMPKGAAKLSDCKIAQIESWINNGRKNN